MIFITILLTCFICITGRFLARQLVKQGIKNVVTDIILFDLNIINGKEDFGYTKISDLSDIYPFDSAVSETEADQNLILKFYLRTVELVKYAITKWTTDYLIGYIKVNEWAKTYQKWIKWNFASHGEYNGVVEFEKGNFTVYAPKEDIEEDAKSIAELMAYCSSIGSDFLFIQLPGKLNQDENSNLCGIVDFSNENADTFLAELKALGVPALDLRSVMRQEGIISKEVFFKTDHHWKTFMGLWAAREILCELGRMYGDEENLLFLSPDKYEEKKFENYFLGGYGKKVTLSRADPEDISIYYPKFRTKIKFVMPAYRISKEGDFSILFNMNELAEKDYYNKRPYDAYMYGNRSYYCIENLNNPKAGDVLCIGDSFSTCVTPYLSLCKRCTYAFDPRQIEFSIRSFIREKLPGTVVVMYTTSHFRGSITWYTHHDIFDFR